MEAFRNTVLLMTADHNEYFGEHDLLYHGYDLYDEVLHVPFIMRGPGVPRAERSDLVSLVDLFDTLCALCNLEAPAHTSGQDVFSGPEREAVYAEYGRKDISREPTDEFLSGDRRRRYGLGRKCVRTQSRKYVLASDGTSETRDLPRENMITCDDGETDRYHDRLVETLGEGFQQIAYGERTSQAVVENLRDLGYIR